MYKPAEDKPIRLINNYDKVNSYKTLFQELSSGRDGHGLKISKSILLFFYRSLYY